MSYNGCANWATWNVILWVDNDEPLYREKLRWLRRRDEYPDEDDVKAFVLNKIFPDGTPDMEHAGEMDEVDWAEVADAWREDWEGEQ